jgi:uncharacterized protein YdaU (DUF1376 family)
MSRPWMPLYIADYLRDTRKLTTAEHGAYLLLIMEYWTAGELPADDRLLSRIVGMTPQEWRRAKPNVQTFFTDGWRHKRIDHELSEAERISNAGRKAGLASANARRNKAATIVQRSSNETGNDPPTIVQPSQSPSQRKKEDSADALTPTKLYAFEDGVIRLNQRDFEAWRGAFSYLDLAAELLSLSKWAESEGKNWFHAVKGALAKRNREVKAAKERTAAQGGPKWLDDIEGVI